MPQWEILVEQAPSGTVIYFQAGEYKLESFFLYKKSNLALIGGGDVRFSGYRPDANILTLQYCTNILIHNITLSHLRRTERDSCTGDVISVRESEDISIYDCDLNGSGIVGVRLKNVSNIFMFGNTFHENSSWALHAWDSESITLMNNLLFQNGGVVFNNGFQYTNDLSDKNPSGVFMKGNVILSNRTHTNIAVLALGNIQSIVKNIEVNSPQSPELLDLNQDITYIYPGGDWQKTVNSVKSYSTIEFTPGDYYGNIVLEQLKGVRLLGSENVRVVGTNSLDVLLRIDNCSQVNVEGIKFEYRKIKGSPVKSNEMISVIESKEISFNECVIKGPAVSAFQVYGCDDIIIQTCLIQDAQLWTLDISHSFNIDLFHNKFLANGGGVFLNGKVLYSDDRSMAQYGHTLRKNIYVKVKVRRFSVTDSAWMDETFQSWLKEYQKK